MLIGSSFFVLKIINFIMKEICFFDAKIGKEYVVSKIILEENLKCRLSSLGIEENSKIKLLKYNLFKSAFLIKNLNILYAIDKIICKGIFVYE